MGGKKKPWIDKRSAASFHLVQRPADAEAEADNGESDPPPPSSAVGGAAPSRYLLQSSRLVQRLPDGFPSDLLVNSASTAAALQGWRAEEGRRRLQREREAMDATALPHDYDYSTHLREMGGGVFIPAGGAAGERSGVRVEVEVVDVRAASAAVVADELDREVDWALVRKAETEGRQRRRRRGTAAAKLPADVLRALQEDDEHEGPEVAAKEGRGGGAVSVVDAPMFDEMEDDFVLKAMEGPGLDQTEGSEAEEGKEGEWTAQGEEEEEEADEGVEDAAPDRRLRALERGRQRKARGDEKGEEGKEREKVTAVDDEAGDDVDDFAHWPRRGGGLAEEKDWEGGEEEEEPLSEEDGEEEEEDGGAPAGGVRSVELEFERLLRDVYADEDIGGLDDAADDDGGEGRLVGPLSLSSLSAALDGLLEQGPQATAEGATALSLNAEEVAAAKRRMERRLRAMQAEAEQEEQLQLAQAQQPTAGRAQGEEGGGHGGVDAEAEWLLPTVYRRGPREEWDVQSVLSTLTNAENHPQAIVEERRGARRRTWATAEQTSGIASTSALAELIGRSAEQLRGQGQHRQLDEVEEEEEDGKGREQPNQGEARPRGETAEDKRARKAASKAEQRERRQRRRQLRSLAHRA